MTQRPTSVTILASLQLINSLGLLFITLSVIFNKDAAFYQVNQNLEPHTKAVFTMLFVGFMLFCCLVSLILSYGLFTLREWAWTTSLILQIIVFIQHLYAIFHVMENRGLTVIYLVINAVIIYYLIQPNVKRSFGKA